ncbi:MAG: response regulator [Acidobacteriota bacterium]
MNILLAEDDSSSRKILHEMLAELGHQVTVCEDGKAAWEAFQRNDYRLVVSDYSMPHLNGVELCQKIRSANNPHHTYFILQTSCSEKSALLKALASGVDDILLKPVDLHKLRAKLEVAEKFFELEQQSPCSAQVLDAIKEMLIKS